MSAEVSNAQQIFLMIKAFLGVLLILASPVLISLFKTGQVMERRYPRKKQPTTVVPETTLVEITIDSVIEPKVNVVVEIPLLPYAEPGIRKPAKHELDGFNDILGGKVDVALANLHKKEGETVRVAGMVIEVQAFKTRKKEYMANAAITDPSGGAEITMYPITWAATPIDRGDIVLLKGKIQEGVILVNSLEIIGEVPFGTR